MSSPITAIESCSKLSAHISFGISIKEIFQMANKRIEILKIIILKKIKFG